MELVILAAGMGSRFGGLKQIEPIGPNDEFIIDYSIYDAIRAGFDKVTFIIKEENYEIFKETIGSRIEDKIDVSYVFQINRDNDIPTSRVKPLGTAYAILCAKDVVKDNFIVINADDFYGFDAYQKMAGFIKTKISDNYYGMAGYQVKNTLSSKGSVKRGICVSKDDLLKSIVECKIDSEYKATTLETESDYPVKETDLVSMNMFAFTPKIFDYLESGYYEFLAKNDLTNDEYLLPTVINDLIKMDIIDIEVIKTTAKWYGVTYKEDKEHVVDSINELVSNKKYPYKLW